jgi:hypothetical protein
MRSSFRLVGEYSVMHTVPVYVPLRTGKSPFLLIADSGCFKFAGARVFLILAYFYKSVGSIPIMVVLGTHTNLKPVAKARAAKTGPDLFPVG